MKGSVVPIVDFITVCEGWMVFVLVGALIMFLAGLFFLGFYSEVWCGCWYGCVHYLVVCCYMLYVHYVLALLFISLCGDAFVHGSAILTVVLGAPNLCGRCRPAII